MLQATQQLASQMLDRHFNPWVHGGAEWYLHRVNPDTRQGSFVRMNRCDYRSSVFLDERICRPGTPPLVSSMPPVTTGIRPAPLPAYYIFHSAFCASTLLTRALEADPQTLVLREPLALLQLAETHRLHGKRWHGNKLSQLVRLSAATLSRGFPEQRRVIIKPSNLVTGLANDLMAPSRCHGLLMYQDLSDFLISCAKKDRVTQNRLLQLPQRLTGCFGVKPLNQPIQKEIGTNLFKAAAMAWLIQMRYSHSLLNSRIGPRLKSLSVSQFLNAPRLSCSAVTQHFSMPPITRFDWLKVHAKQPQAPYSATRRNAEHSNLKVRYSKELDHAMNWLSSLFPGEADEHLVALEVTCVINSESEARTNGVGDCASLMRISNATPRLVDHEVN